MITYEKILENPEFATSLLGLSLAEFERLYAEFELVYRTCTSALPYTRRHKAKRRRAVGGGRKHKYSLRNRLLMTLFWLRAYTTYQVLGSLYHLDKTTVADNLNEMLGTLARMTTLNLERPQAEIPKLRTLQELLNAFPEVRSMTEIPQNGKE